MQNLAYLSPVKFLYSVRNIDVLVNVKRGPKRPGGLSLWLRIVASRISFLKAMLKFVLRLCWTNACVLLAFKWIRKTVNVALHCLGRCARFIPSVSPVGIAF